MINLSILTTISTLIKFLTAFLINKIIAIYIGPTGLTIVGQLQNFIAIIVSLSNFGSTQGVTKYIASSKYEENTNSIMSTSFKLTIVMTLCLAVSTFIFNFEITMLIFKNLDYSNVILIFSLSLLFFSINNLILSIINGKHQYKKLIYINIFTNIISLCLIFLFVNIFSIIGILYSYVIIQVLTLFFTFYILRYEIWFKMDNFLQPFNKVILGKLFNYSIITLVTVLATNLSLLAIREIISSEYSTIHAGYWQGLFYISAMYLLFITTPLNIYYFPKIASFKSNEEIKNFFYKISLIVIPATILLAILIYLFKNYIILIAFNENFVEMEDLFLGQLIGDVFKMSSWLLSYIMIAKAKVKKFVITELFLNINFIILGYIFIKIYGLIGVTYAYAINYFLYLLILYFVVYKKELN